MEVALRQDSTEFDDLLSFVGGFGIGDGVELMNSEVSELKDMSDGAWLDELDGLFEETSVPQNPAVVVDEKESLADLLANGKPCKKEKSLTLPTAASASKTKKRTSSRSRMSRKDELEYLRLKVKDMETKLQELKDNSNSDKASPPPNKPSPRDDQQSSVEMGHSIALWKTMAERQKNQRELVEVENAKLREKLKTQVRMAKSLKRVLIKRTRDEDLVSSVAPKRMKPQLRSVNSTADPFDEMLQHLDELYDQTDIHIAQSPAASLANPVIRKRDVKYSDAAGMFLEFQDSKLLPFDIHTVGRATWRFLAETGHKINNYIEEHVEMRDNTMLRKFGVEIKHGDSVAVLFGKQVTRQYGEHNRIVLVRHSIVDEIQLSGATTSGLTFRESGWIVLKDASFAGSGPATMTRAYSTISPIIDLNANWEVGALTDFVLQSREDVEAGSDTIIENLLLEEVAKQLHTT